MYKISVFIFLSILLVACSPSPSQADIQIAIALTQTAAPIATPEPTNTPSPTMTLEPTTISEPTNTPTPELTSTPHMAKVDISPYLTEGLPDHMSGTVLSTEELLAQNVAFGDINFGKFFVNQKFHNAESDVIGGIVIVSAWDNQKDAEDLYSQVARIVGTRFTLGDLIFEPSVGEESVGGNSAPGKHLAFRTCGVVVFVSMGNATEDQIIAYSQNLERNLNEALCRYLKDQ